MKPSPEGDMIPKFRVTVVPVEKGRPLKGSKSFLIYFHEYEDYPIEDIISRIKRGLNS